MKNEKKLQIVMFSMSSYSEWQKGIQNRNYHILQNLVKDERVEKIVMIDYLPHTWKRFFRNWQRNILKKNNLEEVKSTFFTKIYKVSEKLFVYSSILPKLSSRKFYHQLNKFLISLGFKDYLVWSCYPLNVSYFKELPAKLFVFDTVDNWSEHPSYAKFKKQLIQNYKTINKKADLLFTVSSDLQNLYDDSSKVYWIPNGVDVKHYQQNYPIINRDIGEIKKPIIGYVGTIQDRLDQDLLEFLAKSNPDKSFVMVGPVWYAEIKERFKKFANVYFLGRKSYEEVPMYIQQFAVGIIPHKVDRFIKSTNPMKMYEYLACQKPIISTAGGDIEQFKDQVIITNDFQEFNNSIQKALTDENEKAKQEKLEIIKEHSWFKRVEQMLELIEKKL